MKTARGRVFHEILLNGPVACFEIEQRRRMLHQTASARITELVDMRMVLRMEETKQNPHSGMDQELLRALPKDGWLEAEKKPKKKEIIDGLAKSLIAYITKYPDDPDLHGNAMTALDAAGWTLKIVGDTEGK